MADDGGKVAMPARLYTKHAEPGVGIVECDPLDDASEHFRSGWGEGGGMAMAWIIPHALRVWRAGGV